MGRSERVAAGIGVGLALLLSLVGLHQTRADQDDGNLLVSRQAVQLAYPIDTQTAAFRSTIASADSTGFGSATTSGLTLYPVGRRQTISLNARFSAASESCVVTLAFVNGSTIKDMQQPTLTATAIEDADAAYMSETSFVDTHGATAFYITVTTAPTAGTVDLWVGSY